MENKDLGCLLAEIEDLKEKIEDLKEEIAEAKKEADTNFGYYTEESDKFRRYRDAVKAVVDYLNAN